MLPTRTPRSPRTPTPRRPDSLAGQAHAGPAGPAGSATPALRRDRRAAVAHTRRRTHAASALAAGAVVGLAAIGGFATSAAAADLDARPATSFIAAQTAPLGAVSGITADARTTLDTARTITAAAADATADVATSGLEVPGTTAVDTTDLRAQIDLLASVDVVPLLLVPELTDDARNEVRKVTQLTADLRARLDAAQKQAAAEKAAAEAAAKKQREAEAAAAALAAANTVDGAKASARSISASDYGWGADQFSCLDSLWTKESGWDYRAYNASSGATGIPQALPGSKMASAGGDWQTSAATQIRWGLGYIAAAYGTPCSAWGHSQSTNWY